MAYISNNEISFAEDYYMIDGRGRVTFEENTPREIIEKFWLVWPDFHKKVVELQKKGILSSEYPVLPFDDPIENRKHYIKKER